MILIVFGIVATLGLLTALGTVLARNLVHAALFLVGFFFLVACQFILLEAEFMAAMQVLVYIGAVSILLLFGIMLTRNIQGDETTGGSLASKVLAGVVAFGMLAVLVVGVLDDRGTVARSAWSAARERPPAAPLGTPTADPRSAAINNMSKVVGDELMTRFVVPFEVAGLLLTAALVGAVALAMGEGEGEEQRGERFGRIRTINVGNGDGHPASEKAEALTTTTPASVRP